MHQGKVRYIGCSHMPAWQVVDSLWTSRTDNLARFIACEDERAGSRRDRWWRDRKRVQAGAGRGEREGSGFQTFS